MRQSVKPTHSVSARGISHGYSLPVPINILKTTCHKLNLVIACCPFPPYENQTQKKTRRPGAHARPKAVASLHPPPSTEQYMAPMRHSDSAGGHAGAQVAPRGKPAQGGVPATPRGRQGSIHHDVSFSDTTHDTEP